MKILREIRQNRLSIIIGILICIFVIGVVQIVNSLYKEKNQEKKNNEIDDKYKNESKTIISDDGISKKESNSYGELIESFLNNCVEGKFTDAYNKLSLSCKNIYYPTQEDFVEKYCKTVIKEKTNYKFQLWSTGDNNIYQVKLYDDMLSSGKADQDTTIDYYTIKTENGHYKLNINSYIGTQKINKFASIDKLKVQIDDIEIYKDYYIANIRATNDSKRTIILDSRKNTNSVYAVDENGTKFMAQMYELTQDDLNIKAGEQKNIRIKFNIIYRDDLELQKIVFRDIQENNNIEKLEISL